MQLISCSDLALGYEGKTVAKHITFSVEEGDYLCVVGENGSGKSTLVKTLLGLLPPLSGEIKKSELLKKSGVGYLPQQTPVRRDFPATVEEIVRSGFSAKSLFRPFYTKEEKRRAEEKMERLGILPMKKRCFFELSGGQQQRVLLARALCAAENLLLLDEPVAGLDPKVTAEMYELIRSLNTADRIAIIMISHDIRSVLLFATHILHVQNGGAFFGTAEEYRKSEIGRAFLGGASCSQS